jgi:hypothetical protein
LKSLRARLKRRSKKPPRLSGYKADFPTTAEAFHRFLDRAALHATPGDGQPIGVGVMPWLATPAPWYMLALAVGLHRRGRRVTILWDDTEIQPTTPGAREQNELIGPVLDRMEPAMTVVRLSRQPKSRATPEDQVHLSRLARLNEAWRLRGGLPTAADVRLRRVVEKNLANTFGRLRGALARQAFEYLIVTGGIWGSSGLFLQAGADAGVRVSTYDAGQGWYQASNSGIAAQQTDVGPAFRDLWRDDLVALEPWLTVARAEFDARVSGRDRAQFQVVEAGGQAPEFPVDVLIPMNVDFDSAALGRHVHFADTTEWVTETIAFTLANSEAHVVVRQHPSERRDLERSRLDLGKHLRDRFGAEPRIRFIEAEQSTSSYDLLRSAGLVVPFVSTFGIEAAALGKTVLLGGASYYGDLGFVWAAHSRAEYFDLLAKGLAYELPALPHQREKAWLCYYLSQCCNRVWTDFTPQPRDYWKWCDRSPDELFADPAVADLLTSFDQDVPLVRLRHERLAGAVVE